MRLWAIPGGMAGPAATDSALSDCTYKDCGMFAHAQGVNNGVQVVFPGGSIAIPGRWRGGLARLDMGPVGGVQAGRGGVTWTSAGRWGSSEGKRS